MKTLTITWLNDDYADLTVDGEKIISLNYDDHGSNMKHVIEASARVAKACGATVTVEGEPGQEINL